MTLLLAELGRSYIILRIGGNERERHYLAGLGFVPGEVVSVVSKFNKYVLVNVKGARVGLSEDLAKRVIII